MHDHLWVRILDVPVALAARRYDNPGTLVLAVEDAFRPAVAGRYRLEVADDGTATCDRVGDLGGDADVTLGVTALGSLYLGDVSATQLARAGRLRATNTARRTADRIFKTAMPPHCTMGF